MSILWVVRESEKEEEEEKEGEEEKEEEEWEEEEEEALHGLMHFSPKAPRGRFNFGHILSREVTWTIKNQVPTLLMALILRAAAYWQSYDKTKNVPYLWIFVSLYKLLL